MRSKIFSNSYNDVIHACKEALKKIDCQIQQTSNEGTINASRGGHLLSFGHDISISIKRTNNKKIKIRIESKSAAAFQLVDWGSNSDNEDELLELISNILNK